MATQVEQAEQQVTDQMKAEYIRRARDQYGSDEIEIDDGAQISKGDGSGAFVAAWVWVADEEDEDELDLEYCSKCFVQLESGQIGRCEDCREAEDDGDDGNILNCSKCGEELPMDQVTRVCERCRKPRGEPNGTN